MPYDNLTDVNSVKAWIKNTTTGDDAEIGVLIPVASDLIGRYCGRDNLGAVYTYTENYFRSGSFRATTRTDSSLTLRHYPIVSITQVLANNTPIQILTQAQLQSAQAGIFVQEDVEPRLLKFRLVYAIYPITVVYSAGYPSSDVPNTLQQACNQLVAEILRSASWVGQKSQAMAGETTAYDLGGTWGMSNRVQAMCQPYRDVVPFRYF